MIDLKLFRIRPFTTGVLATLLGLGRPRRAAVHADRLAAGHLAAAAWLLVRIDAAVGRHLHAAADGGRAAGRAGSGWLSDRYGPRLFAAGGMMLGALTFLGLMLLNADFDYWMFAALLFLNGVGSGLFSAPNATQTMNAVPAARARPGLGHPGDGDECRAGAVDRRVLHADDHRPRAQPAGGDGVASGRRRACRRRSRRRWRTSRRWRACSRRSSATTRWAS